MFAAQILCQLTHLSVPFAFLNGYTWKHGTLLVKLPLYLRFPPRSTQQFFKLSYPIKSFHNPKIPACSQIWWFPHLRRSSFCRHWSTSPVASKCLPPMASSLLSLGLCGLQNLWTRVFGQLSPSWQRQVTKADSSAATMSKQMGFLPRRFSTVQYVV